MIIRISPEDQKEFHYEIECVLRMFLPEVELTFSNEEGESKGPLLRVETLQGTQESHNRVKLILGDFHGEEVEDSKGDRKKTELSVCRLVYRLLEKATGRSLEWGIMTGIRPVKIVREMRDKGMTPEKITRVFATDFLVSPHKTALCLETDLVQQPVIATARPKGYSLYVSIPFCPTRCSYCSFVSHSIEKTRKLIPEYLEKLVEELRYTAKIVREKGLVLQTVYIGGGTPTVLTAQQLKVLLDCINEEFDRSGCTEFTVEAGRPDTITREKLEVLVAEGVDRISINTQTLSDEILRQVGRKHTAQDFFDTFELAKGFPFTAVNVDLIAGLTGETPESFRDSLDRIIALEPANITVHSLTMKRAARMIDEKSLHLEGFSPVSDMVNYSQQALAAAGYLPYYLYRQKSTVDSLENVGFCKENTPCRYNVYIMDETHTVVSAGGGGVTKIVLPNNRIERIFNYKYPYEYISRFQTILERKNLLKEFEL